MPLTTLTFSKKGWYEKEMVFPSINKLKKKIPWTHNEVITHFDFEIWNLSWTDKWMKINLSATDQNDL